MPRRYGRDGRSLCEHELAEEVPCLRRQVFSLDGQRDRRLQKVRLLDIVGDVLHITHGSRCGGVSRPLRHGADALQAPSAFWAASRPARSGSGIVDAGRGLSAVGRWSAAGQGGARASAGRPRTAVAGLCGDAAVAAVLRGRRPSRCPPKRRCAASGWDAAYRAAERHQRRRQTRSRLQGPAARRCDTDAPRAWRACCETGRVKWISAL